MNNTIYMLTTSYRSKPYLTNALLFDDKESLIEFIKTDDTQEFVISNRNDKVEIKLYERFLEKFCSHDQYYVFRFCKNDGNKNITKELKKELKDERN